MHSESQYPQETVPKSTFHGQVSLESTTNCILNERLTMYIMMSKALISPATKACITI